MRILLFSVVCMVCMGLTGCTLYNSWIIKTDVKDVKGAYPPGSGEAGRGDAIFGRTLLITTQKVNKELLENLPKVKVTVDNDNKTKSALIGKE